MRSKHFYKHKNNVDVFIEVIKVQYRDAKRIKARVNFYNQGYTNNPWIILHNQPIIIVAEQFTNWVEIYPEIKL